MPVTAISQPAMRAAVAINTKTDQLLRRLGMDPGQMTQSNHETTARIIEQEAGVSSLIEALDQLVATAHDSSWAHITNGPCACKSCSMAKARRALHAAKGGA